MGYKYTREHDSPTTRHPTQREPVVWAHRDLVLKGSCLVSQPHPPSVLTGLFQGCLWAAVNNVAGLRLCAELRARGKQRKKTCPECTGGETASKGYAPPTHSFPLIKDSEEVRAGDKKRGSQRNVCFESSVSQVRLNEGQLGDSGYSSGRCLDGREQTLNGVGALLSGKRTIHLPPVSF